MQKPCWRKVETKCKKPSPRWGHTCCVVGEQIVFFGGYADSNYMNDVWSYNANTKKWEDIATTGSRPSPRSNCSMNYNCQNQQIVIFGGGGPNKQRFNTIYLLDWKTKVWVEIAPKQNQPAPWERTYHVAEVKFPYLVLFGGEGVSDLDDLWVFNFLTFRWTEVKSDQKGVKPCPRRFHSSCMINNEFFVIAGCRGKYRCLSDIYSLDLTSLMETGSTKDLRWVERKFKGSSFLSRWGHSSVVYDQKIYIFAGRFSNDLNDLLMVDIQNNTLRNIKVGGNSNDHPKPRRRHCAGFVGSCMIGFGGFNGEYFNDLFYINMFELSHKVTNSINLAETNLSCVNNKEYSDHAIYAKDGSQFHINLGLIARYFKSEGDFINYLGEIDYRYTYKELLNIFTSFYRGYGKFELEEQSLHQRYGIFFNQAINRRVFIDNIINIQQKQSNCLDSPQKSSNIVFQMQNQQFALFLQNRNNWWFNDVSIEVVTPASRHSKIKVNKFLLTTNSLYFRNMLSDKYCQNEGIKLSLDRSYGFALDLFFNFVMMGVVVAPQTFSYQLWMDLADLSDYFCVHELKSLCESQLCTKVCSDKVQMLSTYSQKMQLPNLSLHCAHFQIKNSITTNTISKKGDLLIKKDKSHSFIKLYNTIKFDLLHSNPVQAKSLTSKGKNDNSHDKQNEMEYANV